MDYFPSDSFCAAIFISPGNNKLAVYQFNGGWNTSVHLRIKHCYVRIVLAALKDPVIIIAKSATPALVLDTLLYSWTLNRNT